MTPDGGPRIDQDRGRGGDVPDDDRALVGRATAGDRDALERLLARHYDRVYGVCRRVIGNDSDAADAAQEAMISVVRNLAGFDGRSAFSTWIYRIATNAALDELRRRRRRPRPAQPTIADHEPVDQRSEARLSAVTDRPVLDAALAGLAETFRVPLVLRDVADLEYAEIAAILGVPVGTVKSRIARGRAALAGELHDGNRDRPSGRPRLRP